tara:strand:+ start:892 stop:1080 length:189 start_codon:yes stop_codon:yes gene_type:complete
MGLDDGIPEKSVEHTHKDGTKHSHVGGDKPHTHDKKEKSCTCREDGSRNPRCREHGDRKYII